MVLPVKGTVKDIAIGSATGAMDTARCTLTLEHVSRTQQALARCTRPLALAQRTQPVLTARKTRLARRKFMKQATVRYVKFSTEITKYSVNVATHSLKLHFKYVLAEHN